MDRIGKSTRAFYTVSAHGPENAVRESFSGVKILEVGQGCSEAGGRVAPVVDRNRCEGKADCVRVCPYGVFAVQVLSSEQRRGLSWRGRLKALAHGGRQAFVVDPLQCHACKRCIDACPEEALTLRPIPDGAEGR